MEDIDFMTAYLQPVGNTIFYPANFIFNYYFFAGTSVRIIFYNEGFSEPLRGIENPRSSIDVTELRSVKSTEDYRKNPIYFSYRATRPNCGDILLGSYY